MMMFPIQVKLAPSSLRKGLRNKIQFTKLGWWMMEKLFDLIIMNERVIGENKMGPLLKELGQAVSLHGQTF